jgi:hypothetical protein
MVRSSFSPAPGSDVKDRGPLLPRIGRGADDRPVRTAPSDYSEYVKSRAVLAGCAGVNGYAVTIPRRRRS